MPSFLERLSRGPVLCDGAMGTLLYAKGVFINRCYDELNLSQPEMVAGIHAEYVKAGAEVLETNTFGANRYRLLRHGFEGRVRRSIAPGCNWRAPPPATMSWWPAAWALSECASSRSARSPAKKRAQLSAQQIEVLAAEGVDLLLLETFGYIDELHQAVLAAREAAPGMPVVAQVTIDDEGNALDGTEPEVFGSAAHRVRRRSGRLQLLGRSGRHAGHHRAPAARHQPALWPRSPTPACRAASRDATSICVRRSTWPSIPAAWSPPASRWSAAAAAPRRSTSGP